MKWLSQQTRVSCNGFNTACNFHNVRWFSPLFETFRLTVQYHSVESFVQNSTQHLFTNVVLLLGYVDKTGFTSHCWKLADHLRMMEDFSKFWRRPDGCLHLCARADNAALHVSQLCGCTCSCFLHGDVGVQLVAQKPKPKVVHTNKAMWNSFERIHEFGSVSHAS